MAIESLSIFQLDKHGVSLSSVEQSEGKLMSRRQPDASDRLNLDREDLTILTVLNWCTEIGGGFSHGYLVLVFG